MKKSYLINVSSFGSILGMVFILGACGGSSGGSSTATGAATAPVQTGTCGVNQVMTNQYGCQVYNQASCPVNNTLYNGVCTPYTGTVGTGTTTTGYCTTPQVNTAQYGCQNYNPSGCNANQTNVNGTCVYIIPNPVNPYATGTVPNVNVNGGSYYYNNGYYSSPVVSGPPSYASGFVGGYTGGTVVNCVQTSYGCLPTSPNCPVGWGVIYQNGSPYCAH